MSDTAADESFNRPAPAVLVGAGVKILAVYSTGAGKAISKPEWDAYIAAGIALLLVDEHGNQQMLNGGTGFGTAIARENMAAASALQNQLRRSRPIYYVAEDPNMLPQSAWPVVVARFQEVAAEHLRQGWVLPGDNVGGSLVGSYGGGPLCEHLYDVGLARWPWVVGTWNRAAAPHAVLIQDPNTTQGTLGGAIDRDYLPAGVTDCGQYPPPGASTRPAPSLLEESAMISTTALVANQMDTFAVTAAGIVHRWQGAGGGWGREVFTFTDGSTHQPVQLDVTQGLTAPQAGAWIDGNWHLFAATVDNRQAHCFYIGPPPHPTLPPPENTQFWLTEING